jgi:hypothetical protein
MLTGAGESGCPLTASATGVTDSVTPWDAVCGGLPESVAPKDLTSITRAGTQVKRVFSSIGVVDCVLRGHLGPMATAWLWFSNQTTKEDWSAPERRC